VFTQYLDVKKIHHLSLSTLTASAVVGVLMTSIRCSLRSTNVMNLNVVRIERAIQMASLSPL